MKSVSLLVFGFLMLNIVACSPEVGSDKWCKNMADQPSGEWTANEAADYAKHCVFKKLK